MIRASTSAAAVNLSPRGGVRAANSAGLPSPGDACSPVFPSPRKSALSSGSVDSSEGRHQAGRNTSSSVFVGMLGGGDPGVPVPARGISLAWLKSLAAAALRAGVPEDAATGHMVRRDGHDDRGENMMTEGGMSMRRVVGEDSERTVSNAF